MLKHLMGVLCLLAVLLVNHLPALAQSQSASADLTGAVSDPSKSWVRGAKITAVNVVTGLKRTVLTDASGAFRIQLLPPGEYELKIEAEGFVPQIKKGILLTVGQTAVFNFEVALGLTSSVELVEIETPILEPERTHLATTITQKAINNLPINGRNFLDFVMLTPGVAEENPAFRAGLLPQLPTSGLSFAGQNGRANSVQIDGVDNNDVASNGVRPTITQETVQEFQINSHGYNAEFGRASGGVINIVSKTGSNRFRGNVYNYLRNERLDARNNFATSQQQDPPFKRNQPGFTLGGPISKDRTFFFTSYEGLFRRESAFTTILADPSILQPTAGQQNLIQALSRSGSSAYAAQGGQLQALLTTGPNSPFPSPTQTFPINRTTYNFLTGSTGSFPVSETSSTGSLRVDHALSERDYLFFRYGVTNDSQHNIGVGGQFAPSAGFDLAVHDHTLSGGETHLFRNGVSNEFRLQLVRNVFNANTVDPFGPRYVISGIGFFGREFTLPSERTQRRIQFVDNFSLTHGRHNFKFGGEFNRTAVDNYNAYGSGGILFFSQSQIPLSVVLGDAASTQLVSALNTPVANGGLGRPDLVPVVTTQPLSTVQQLNFGFPRAITQGFGNPNSQVSGNLIGLYWQDSVRVNQHWYFNFGLRYDYQMQPPGTPRDNNNFGPRVGFSFDPFKDGRTLVRGGGGVYFQSLYGAAALISSLSGNGNALRVTADPRQTPISPNSTCAAALAMGVPPAVCFYRQLVSSGILTFPSSGSIPESAYMTLLGLSSSTSTNRLLQRLAGNAVNPYSVQGSLGIEHQLQRDWTVSLNYRLTRGAKLIRNRQVNALPDPTVLDALGRPSLVGRANPTVLADFVLETAGNSIYHGLSFSMNKRFSRYYQLIGSYTYGKTIDDATDLNIDQAPQDGTNTRAERGLSTFDVRQRLSVAAIFDSPFRGGAGRPWHQSVLSNFYVSPILTLRNGFPFNITTGLDINMDSNGNDRPLAVGRNTGVGPGYFNMDWRLGRRFRFGDDDPRSFEFILDAFNLLNRTNYKAVNGNTNGVLYLNQLGARDVRVRGSEETPANRFGGFTSAFDPRIVQLALKLSF